MTDARHKEVVDKLDQILKNQQDINDRYLPKYPYKAILAIPRFVYENPKSFFAFLLVAGEIVAEFNKVGLITSIISIFVK